MDVLANGICQSTAFKRLDQLQRRLDAIDLDGISKLIASRPHEAELDRPIELSEFEGLLPLISSEASTSEYMQMFDTSSLRQKLVMYMLSMTLKDCSAFVRLVRPLNDSEDIRLSVEVTLIDLDLKPLTRLQKYITRDVEVMARFKQLLEAVDHPITCTELLHH